MKLGLEYVQVQMLLEENKGGKLLLHDINVNNVQVSTQNIHIIPFSTPLIAHLKCYCPILVTAGGCVPAKLYCSNKQVPKGGDRYVRYCRVP